MISLFVLAREGLGECSEWSVEREQCSQCGVWIRQCGLCGQCPVQCVPCGRLEQLFTREIGHSWSLHIRLNIVFAHIFFIAVFAAFAGFAVFFSFNSL